MAEITQVNKYNHSKIYKICSNLTDNIYIGSTTQSLSQRLSEHVRRCKHYIKIDNNYISSFEIIKLGDYYITLIEECNFNNKSQLLKREGEIIKLNINNVVNKMIAGRTKAEYRVDTKAHIIERNKQYRVDNKQLIAERMKQYYNDNKQNRQDNKQLIAEQKKQYYNDNKHVIAEQNKQPIICECGSTITKHEKPRHMKSPKHINILQQLFNNELNHYYL